MDYKMRDIPEETHMRFKLLCVRNRISMNRKLIELMEQAVEEAAAELEYDAPSIGKSIADAVKKGPVKDAE